MESNASSGRSIDIELSGGEVITIDLENLELDNLDDILDLLKDGQCKVFVWTKLAAEYWRRGHNKAAERIAQAAVESFKSNGMGGSLSPVYSLLANIHTANARKAPKIILPDAREDNKIKEKPKDEYIKEATTLLNSAALGDLNDGNNKTLFVLSQGIQHLGNRALDDALKAFEGVLTEKPTNVIALLGKARILYTQRRYQQALKLFQQVLRLKPNCKPDPRVGIGLCLWAMDDHARARTAWERSLEVNPDECAARLLLGIDAVNLARDENAPEAERAENYTRGTKLIEQAFKANHDNAAAANALCEHFIQKGNYKMALKLAERTIQYADTVTVLVEGHLRAARTCHSEGHLPLATKHFTSATKHQPKNPLASIGLAQMQMKNNELAAAAHTLDVNLQSNGQHRPLEALVMLASIRAYPRPGLGGNDLSQERARARELYERVTRSLELDEQARNNSLTTNLLERSARKLGEDTDMHIEMSKLWQYEGALEKMGKSLKDVRKILAATGKVDSRVSNNLGVLAHLDGNVDEARQLYESALTSASSTDPNAREGLETTMLYNLARAYEDQGELSMAKDAYDKLLSRHPEYVDAKIRQVHMFTSMNQNNDANELLKQALVSQNGNLNVRAYYTYFLIHTALNKMAKDFVFSTLKDHDKHDVYSLCAAGWILYNQARESRDVTQTGVQERRKNFQRAAEFYEKALQVDSQCAIAAQGLAIITAEDALGTLNGVIQQPAPNADEAQRRIKNARDALDIFAKVRESINDGSVYMNMGHCYYFCDEFDRAIESYETASTRFYNHQNVSVLLCLCRSWYAKATKDQSYTAMNAALRHAQNALHIQPSDKAIVYNIAMIQQKFAEMLFTIKPPKRTLKDLHRVIGLAAHAQKLFASLAADTAQVVPYSRDLADQRRKYGESLLRRGDEHLATQKEYEAETQSRLEAARQKRQDDREKQEALERERLEAKLRDDERLAEERRKAREQAMQWTIEARGDSEDEREKKPRRPRKAKTEGSGDEGPTEQPKKRRRGKVSRRGASDNEGDGGASSEDEQPEKQKKRGPRKRVVRDEDDEEAAAPRKKQFKSKEMLSDTDEEEMAT